MGWRVHPLCRWVVGRWHTWPWRVYTCSRCLHMCYAEKATPARHRPERQHNARSKRRKQCSPNETKPYSNPTPPRKRQNTPKNGHTPRRMKPTHTRLTYTRMRPHAPSHQAGDHPVPHTQNVTPRRRCGRNDTQDSPRTCVSAGWHVQEQLCS